MSKAEAFSRSVALCFLYVLISFVIQTECVYYKGVISKVTSGRYGRKSDAGLTHFILLQFMRLGLDKMYGFENGSYKK